MLPRLDPQQFSNQPTSNVGLLGSLSPLSSVSYDNAESSIRMKAAGNDNFVASKNSEKILTKVLNMLGRIDSSMKQQVAIAVSDARAARESFLERKDPDKNTETFRDTKEVGSSLGLLSTVVGSVIKSFGPLIIGLGSLGGVVVGAISLINKWTEGNEHRTPEQIAEARTKTDRAFDKINASKSGKPIFFPGEEPNLTRKGSPQNVNPSKISASISDKGKRIVSKLMNAGLTKVQAAAAVGHWQHESNLNSSANNPNDRGIPSSGLAQWRSERRTALFNFAKKRGTSWKDEDTQIAFFIKELNSNEAAAGNRLKKSTTVAEASRAMTSYERYAGWNGKGRNAADVRHGAKQTAVRTSSAQAHYNNISSRKNNIMSPSPVLQLSKSHTKLIKTSINNGKEFKPANKSIASTAPKRSLQVVTINHPPRPRTTTRIQAPRSDSRRSAGSVPSPGKTISSLSYQQYFRT